MRDISTGQIRPRPQRIQIFLNLQLFLSGYSFHPRSSVESGYFWIRSLSRMENNKSATNPIMCGRENFWMQKENVTDSKISVDCSQPSIFSYFYSIVECTDRIVRELDASTKHNLMLWVDRTGPVQGKFFPSSHLCASLTSVLLPWQRGWLKTRLK